MALTEINSKGIKDGEIVNADIADDTISEAKLDVSNGPTNGQFLQAQSGEGGGLTWATVSSSDATKMPLSGGVFTGDVQFDSQGNAGRDILWDDSDSALEFSDDTQLTIGDGKDLTLKHNGSHSYIQSTTGSLLVESDSCVLRSTGQENYLVGTANGSVDLYHNDVKKFETTAAGVTITGDLTVTGSGAGVTSDAQNNTLAGTNAGNNFTGTDANDNTLIGFNTGTDLTTGDHNTAVGTYALDSCTTGGKNTAVGKTALGALTGGGEHTGIGYYALAGNTTGERNTALGVEAGITNTTGSDQVFIGYKAGNTNNGHQNIFIGGSCGLNMDTGEYNVAIGTSALLCDASGTTHPDNNVAIGNAAMYKATEANENVAVGINAMYDVTTASECVAVGRKALQDVTTGGRNTAVGYQSGNAISDGQHNTCIGYESGATITSGDHNVTIGYQAAVSRITTENNFLMIARDSSSDGTAGCWIHGDSAGACIQGNNSSSWDTTSDERLKKNIEDSTKGLAEIDQIKVRNFEYRTNDEIDMSEFPLADDPSQVSLNDDVKEGVVQTGVIAQEIEAVLPECVVETVKGTKKVNNDPIMWALVNAVKELSAKVKALEAK